MISKPSSLKAITNMHASNNTHFCFKGDKGVAASDGLTAEGLTAIVWVMNCLKQSIFYEFFHRL